MNFCDHGMLSLQIDFRIAAEKEEGVCKVAILYCFREPRDAAAAPPVNCRALTFQSTLPDKARESWQQQLDLALVRLPRLTSVRTKAVVTPSERAAQGLPLHRRQASRGEGGAEGRLCDR